MKYLKKKTRPLLGLLCCYLMIISPFAMGQTQAVNGKVIDAKTKEPIIGASIKVKGTTTGVITDNNGGFRLNAVASSILQVSFVGYKTTESPANFNKFMTIFLSEDVTALQDVVVVAYGSQRKVTSAGSIATVTAKTFQDRGPLANPLAALQGQAPGVTVTRSSAQPGRENWNFQIRGTTSTNGTEPLVIIDGMPIPNLGALNSFNPADIENISFLKDASASIYGARAAGGVVLITTKRAKSGKPTINYNVSQSIKNIGLKPALVDIKDWGPMMLEARLTDGLPKTDIWATLAGISIWAKQNGKNYITRSEYQALINPGGQFQGGAIFGDITDYAFFDGTIYDQMWGAASSTEHQLDVSGRTDKSGYRISLAYLNDGSLLNVGNNSNKRYNIRLAHDYDLSSKLSLQSNISYEKNDIIQPASLSQALNNGIQPGQPLHALNGKPYGWGAASGGVSLTNINPYSMAELGGDAEELNSRINASFNLNYKFNPNLKAVVNTGYYSHNTDYKTREEAIQWYDLTGTIPYNKLSASNTQRSYYQRAARKESYYNLTGFLEFNKNFATNHNVKAMLGGQFERDEMNRFGTKALDPVPEVPSSLNNITSSDNFSKTVFEAQNHYALAGYFSRLNYEFKEKYIFEANARYDGSSKFTQENRWKAFYGLLAAWRINRENFLKNADFINDLKIRASWGSGGNQNGIGLYDYITLLNLNFSGGATSSNFPILGSSPIIRVSPGGLVALDRGWEIVENTTLGADFTILNKRLSGTAEYFIRRNKNMLIARSFPAVLGANAPAGNNGDLKSWGWEASLNWSDKIGKINYHVGGNIHDNQNKLINFGGQKLINSTFRGYNTAVEGYPLNTYFGLQYDGRIQTQEELIAYRAKFTGTNNNIGLPGGSITNPAQSLQLGDNMFKDVNGDGKLTFPEDAVNLGRDDPRFSYSFNGGLDWKGFDFNAIFQGVGKRTIIRDGNWRIPGAILFNSQNAAYLNQWWTPQRIDAELPRISSNFTINNYNYFPSSFVVENGAYLRLKNLVIGYTLPQHLTQKAKIQKLRLYFSGNDLWEKSKIKDGWDPETPRTVETTRDINNNDLATFSQRYPFYRFYTFGLNLTL